VKDASLNPDSARPAVEVDVRALLKNRFAPPAS
jgi:hypothetical protein